MDTPTPLQRQIEETVTNKRGYAPQITPIDLATSLQFPKSLYVQDVYAFLERQRLQVNLQSMEAQQSSPTLGDSFIRYLERILTDSPRPESDIKHIEPNYFPLKKILRNKIFDKTDPFSKPSTDSSSFPWDSAKSRSFREYMDSLRARQQDPFPFDEIPDPHAFDHLTSLEPRPQLPLKEWELLKIDPLPTHHKFPYLKSPREQQKPWREEPPRPDEYFQLKPKENFQLHPKTPPKRRDVYDVLQSLPTPKPNSQFLPPRPNSNPTLEPLEDPQFLDELLRKLDREKKDPKPKKTE